MKRTTAARDRDRADLLAMIQDADGPLTLWQLAHDTHDGADHWERHLQQVLVDLRAMRRAGQLVSDGVEWRSDTMRWALADSTMADEVSDRAEVDRLRWQWEPLPDPVVPTNG